MVSPGLAHAGQTLMHPPGAWQSVPEVSVGPGNECVQHELHHVKCTAQWHP